MGSLKKLAIVTTHPIQYYAPVFKLLSQRKKIQLKVFYTWGNTALNKHDPGFGKPVTWDLPLMDGYQFEWATNVANQPGSHHFSGIITPGLIQQITTYGADAVLIMGWAYHSHLKAMHYFKNKIPVYFRGDSNLIDQQNGLKSILRTIFLKWVYRQIDHAFYTGTNNLAYYNRCGLKAYQLSFAPHAVDNERFAQPRTNEANQLRRQLNIPLTAIVILFAGKFEEKKSPDLLLQAFQILNQPNVHLLFVGNGHIEPHLKTQAAETANVHFMDFANQSDIPVVYQACDLFCLPSSGPGETWGLAINEAMACSKAILASDKCGGAIDLITNANGVIFISRDIDDLVLSLKKLTGNRSLLAKLGACSAKIIHNWSFENIASAIENKLLNDEPAYSKLNNLK